jgi:hypothetical protein
MDIMINNSENDQSLTKYSISGEGVKRVVQESVKTKTNLAFVCDKDIYGRPIRIGYCFTSRDTGKRITSINWFKDGEIDISSKKMRGKNPKAGRLDVKFKHPNKNERHFSITLPFGGKSTLVRFIARVEKDGTKNFVILFQLKSLDDETKKWATPFRYDCSHGFIHKDILSANGRRVIKKVKLLTQNKKEAIKFIVGELLNDITTQITRQPQDYKKVELTLKQDIDTDILNAEKSLLEVFESNEMSELFESTSIMYSEEVNSID